ncbi:hypothetical protein BaRGS_00014712 [Batillaria attramentaria]|uniref:Uncharacterized protein n=1 Tax=Batillaria attramentaria TaxID=370345 RepID=A0ABD0L3D3_9CAEN
MSQYHAHYLNTVITRQVNSHYHAHYLNSDHTPNDESVPCSLPQHSDHTPNNYDAHYLNTVITDRHFDESVRCSLPQHRHQTQGCSENLHSAFRQFTCWRRGARVNQSNKSPASNWMDVEAAAMVVEGQRRGGRDDGIDVAVVVVAIAGYVATLL